MNSRRGFLHAMSIVAAIAPIATLAAPTTRRTRISVDDPDYDSRERYDVFLDGVLIRRVFVADEVKGYVEVAVLDKRGYLKVNADRTVMRETRYGRVRVARTA